MEQILLCRGVLDSSGEVLLWYKHI
jgi:hypothetical protein